jgi:hypothetical protein
VLSAGTLYYFEASGNEFGGGQSVEVAAILDLTPTGTPGVYSISVVPSSWGGVLDPSGNVWAITGTAGYIPYDLCCMDNLVSVPPTFSPAPGFSSPMYIDENGLGFTTDDPIIDGNPQYGVFVGPDGVTNNGQYQFADNGVNGTNAWLPSDQSYAPANVTVTFTTVPDGGTTLALLGLAIAGLAGLRRKLSA